MANLPNSFTVWDYIVFVASLITSMGIGVYFAMKGDGQRTQGEYLMGGRKMQVWPVTISILASFMSAITLLGTPAELYIQGTGYYMYCFGCMLGFLLSGIFFVPLLYPLGLTSAYEYFELRFRSRAVRLLGTYIMVIGQIIYVALASYAPATAFEAVTGFPLWATLLVAGVVTTFYTTIGGMKAVVWTDVFQACLMMAGIICIIIQGTLKVGGVSQIWEINEDWDRIEYIVTDLDPRVRHTIYGLIFGQAMNWIANIGVGQASVQRYCSLPTLQQAQASMMMNVVIVCILITSVCYTGITMFAYYASDNCDLLSQGLVDNSNQLIPYFVMDILAYPPIPGLFMASLFSGALSSMSSSLNAMAAVLWEDTFKPLVGHKLSEAGRTLVLKVMVATLGVACVLASFGTIFLNGTVIQAANSLIAPATGSLAGMFLLGGLFPCANKFGAVAGGITGLTLSAWQAIGYYLSGIENYYIDLPIPNGTCGVNTTSTIMLDSTSTPVFSTLGPEIEGNAALDYFYSISYLYVSLISSFSCIIVGLVISLLTRPFTSKEERDVPSRYLIPIFTRMCCCVSDSCLYYLDCCRKFETPQEISKSLKVNRSMEMIIIGPEAEPQYVGEPDNKTTSYELNVRF